MRSPEISGMIKKQSILLLLTVTFSIRHWRMVGPLGIEPRTAGLRGRCSTDWAKNPLRVSIRENTKRQAKYWHQQWAHFWENLRFEITENIYTPSVGKNIYRHIPNILTCWRIFGSGMIFFWMIHRSFWVGHWKLIFLVALLSTDWLDGYLARKHDWISSLWKILDPIADKILLNGLLVMMIFLSETSLSPLLVGLIIMREVSITLWRIILARKHIIVPADTSWKVKTLLQTFYCVIACLWVFGIRNTYWNFSAWIQGIFHGWLFLICAITLYSGYIMVWRFYVAKKHS